MKLFKLFVPVVVGGLVSVLVGQTPIMRAKKAIAAYQPPKVATTIPDKGIHMTTEIGSFKIKRGSDALNFGELVVSFQGTILVSDLSGTVVPSNGAELEYTQPKFKKQVFFSKGKGTLKVHGQFGGIQFFGQKLDAYYRGDGLVQLYGEFDKNLNTGLYWYDAKPTEKKYWGTYGITLTPQPYQAQQVAAPEIKVKHVGN